MAIEIEEVGRKLKVVVGGEEEFIFSPLPYEEGLLLGVNLFATYAGIASADAGVDPQQAGVKVVETALAEHYDAVTKLRAAEVAEVTNAVQFWQAIGGGFELAQLSIEDPKKALQQWAFLASPLLRMSYVPGEPSETSEDAGSTQSD